MRFAWLAEVMIFHILKACQARHAKGDMRYSCENGGSRRQRENVSEIFYGRVGILIVNFC